MSELALISFKLALQSCLFSRNLGGIVVFVRYGESKNESPHFQGMKVNLVFKFSALLCSVF